MTKVSAGMPKPAPGTSSFPATTPVSAPFRDRELELQVAALREQRDGLKVSLAAYQRELKELNPWRWGIFLLSFFGPPLLLLAAVAIAFLLQR
jgi:hypothetical protein